MKKFIVAVAVSISALTVHAQALKRPKLVVGIVVDQMRWDYLYRFYDRYGSNGFKRMIGEGFTCENTFIPYVPTITACGHASIYTGSVPAINGIAGNDWYDYSLKKVQYCTGDTTVTTVGSNTTAGMQSPRNLFSNTIGDELRLATNFRGKVVGVALKDRGSILPAGHSANAAYWFDYRTGDWITSSFYMKDLPRWVKDFNAKKLPDQYLKEGWTTMYPLNTYVQSAPDVNKYEGKPFGADAQGFPYNLAKFAGTNYGAIASTPWGNKLTAEMAKAALVNEKLGADDITDLLAVSFSSTDYVGHGFGPNSVEAEDIYLRLDKEIADLLGFLDEKVGKDQYTVFLSADHGAAHVPAFVKDNRMPGGTVRINAAVDSLNNILNSEFHQPNLVMDVMNYQVLLDLPLIDSAKLNIADIKHRIISFFSNIPGIARAVDIQNIQSTTLNATIRTRINNGYFPQRCGQVQLIFQPQYFEGYSSTGTTHSLWNPYDAHIPLLWYGWGIKHGATNRETYMTDIAVTVAALLHIQMPNGAVGNAIDEVLARP